MTISVSLPPLLHRKFFIFLGSDTENVIDVDECLARTYNEATLIARSLCSSSQYVISVEDSSAA